MEALIFILLIALTMSSRLIFISLGSIVPIPSRISCKLQRLFTYVPSRHNFRIVSL